MEHNSGRWAMQSLIKSLVQRMSLCARLIRVMISCSLGVTEILETEVANLQPPNVVLVHG